MTHGVSSLKVRYATKLMSNLLVMVAGVIIQTMVPRALGPGSYGNFNFVTNFFQQLIGFLNFNSSTAFYTKLSQRQNDTKLVSFYLGFLCLLGVIITAFILVAMTVGAQKYIWPDQNPVYICAGALWAYLTFFLVVANEMTDAYGLTVFASLAKLVLKWIGLVTLFLLFWSDLIDLANFFIQQLVFIILSIGVVFWILLRHGRTFKWPWSITKELWGRYGAEFKEFCLPLVVFTGVATVVGLLERWLLQNFSGSEEQGFYGLAFQIGSICFMFSSSMTPLLAREYSISYARNDVEEMKRLFLRFVPMLYAITAYFGCFLASEAKSVMLFFGGREYSSAVLPIAIMCLYPLHQTYGQMNASLFFASGRTVAYRNIGIVVSLASLPVTFFLIGPTDYGALNAGATGLAVKMVAIQILGTNLQLFYVSRLLDIPFLKLLTHQISIVVIFFILANSVAYVSALCVVEDTSVVRFLFSGIVYSIFVTGLVISFPSLFSMTRDDFARIRSTFRRYTGKDFQC